MQWYGQHINYPDFHCDRTRVAWRAEACVERESRIFDRRVLVGRVYEPGSCPSKDQQHAENRNKCTTAHPGPQGHKVQRQCFNHGSHSGCVVGVCSGTREGEMSLGGDDKTKHDINSSVV